MPNFTGAGQGAIGGASAGGAFGPIGAIGGGIIGGIAGLFGGSKKKKKISSLDKRQKALNKQQYEALQGKGPMADLYNYDPEKANAVFDKTIANPEYRNYNENVVPGITGAFRSEGLANSSYAGDALSKTGRDLQENLAGRRAEYLYGEQNNARDARRNALENFQNRQNFAYDTSASKGGFDINSILKSLTPEMTQQLADYFKK